MLFILSIIPEAMKGEMSWLNVMINLILTIINEFSVEKLMRKSSILAML